ncbi:MAG: hypothetical protein ACN4G0_19665 [Polyangiales bacterium]
MTYPRLVSLILSIACVSAACTRNESAEELVESGDTARGRSEGSDEALDTVRAAVRALAEPGATVDYVAAQMQGVIKVRKKTQALIHYDGYRAMLRTLGDQVSQIAFDFVEAKPSVSQLSEMFGTPREVRRGMLYEHTSNVSGVRFRLLAEPSEKPANEDSLVRRLVIETARSR